MHKLVFSYEHLHGRRSPETLLATFVGMHHLYVVVIFASKYTMVTGMLSICCQLYWTHLGIVRVPAGATG